MDQEAFTRVHLVDTHPSISGWEYKETLIVRFVDDKVCTGVVHTYNIENHKDMRKWIAMDYAEKLHCDENELRVLFAAIAILLEEPLAKELACASMMAAREHIATLHE